MTRRPRSCNTVAPSVSAEPPFTDEHETLRDSLRRFVANELRPHASEREQARWFPNERMALRARLGPRGGTDRVMKEILGKLTGV
jgi:alkylation response protein AidB-like acyl-CoA dehydrogenase